MLYTPNKFFGPMGLAKRPLSPRRFKKLDIASLARPKESGWAILRILHSVRRAIPDLDAFVAAGSKTSNESSNSWVVGSGPLISTGSICRGWVFHPTANKQTSWESLRPPPNAAVLYRESRTDPMKGGPIRVCECISDFRVAQHLCDTPHMIIVRPRKQSPAEFRRIPLARR